jgi:hypothetical protein
MATKSTRTTLGSNDRSHILDNAKTLQELGMVKGTFADLVKQVGGETRYRLPIGVFSTGEEGVIKHWRYVRATPFSGALYDSIKTIQETSGNKAILGIARSIAEVIESFSTDEGEVISAKELAAQMGYGGAKTHEFFTQMYIADIISMLIEVRRTSNDGNTSFSGIVGECPYCKFDHSRKETMEHVFNLLDLDTHYYEGLSHNPYILVELAEPMESCFADQDPMDAIVLQPIRLRDIEALQGLKPQQSSSQEFARRSICYIRGANPLDNAKPQPMGLAQFLKFQDSRKNIALLMEVIEGTQPGPDSNIEVDCTNCGKEWKMGLPWADLTNFCFPLGDP